MNGWRTPLAVSLLAMLGLAAIIGAFMAGMVFDDAREHYELEHQALPIYQFLVPFFFVITGSQVDWRLFLDLPLMDIALGVTGPALVGQSCRLRAWAWPAPVAASWPSWVWVGRHVAKSD